jgi:predicted nucleic acid-binding protein
VKLAADANVLLSALIGGKAKAVLEHPKIEEVFTVTGVIEEVREYLPGLARERKLPEDVLLMTLVSLPVTIVEAKEYRGRIAEARTRIAERDPDDVELLALALHLDVPVWSNDDDFEAGGTDWYTTAELLARLGMRKPRRRGATEGE